MKRACRPITSLMLVAGLLLENGPAAHAVAQDDIANAGQTREAGTAEPNQPIDLALAADGVLVGQLVDGSGAALAQCQVTVWSDGKQVAQVATQADGVFQVRGLRGGVHVLTTAQGGTVCRFWSNGTAPLGAAQRLLIVDGATVARGQTIFKPRGGWYSYLMTRPLLTVGIVATAIAVPVGVAANSGQNKSGS